MATTEDLIQHYIFPEFISIRISYEENKWLAWICAVCGAFIVGLSGVVPLLIMPDTSSGKATEHKDVNYESRKKHSTTSSEYRVLNRTISSQQSSTQLALKETVKKERTLNRYLSFAVGGLLGDICLHLLPEIYSAKVDSNLIYDGDQQIKLGLSILAGILSFLAIEKLFDFTQVLLIRNLLNFFIIYLYWCLAQYSSFCTVEIF